jgi:hypothetical protein
VSKVLKSLGAELSKKPGDSYPRSPGSSLPYWPTVPLAMAVQPGSLEPACHPSLLWPANQSQGFVPSGSATWGGEAVTEISNSGAALS